MVIPKPLCQCHVCREARQKGVPYDVNLLIDAPAEIASQLNGSDVCRVEYLSQS